MADVTASEITKISTTYIGQQGYDLVIMELYIDHDWLTNDKVFAADIGVDGIWGVLGCCAVDGTGLITPVVQGASLDLYTDRTRVADDAAGSGENTTTAADDYIRANADLNDMDALWVTLLCKLT